MTKKKQAKETKPADARQYDQAAAAQMAADVAAAEDVAGDGAETSGLESIRAELQEANNRVLRKQAELENYRKRATREMHQQHRYAHLPLMRDLLPVLDNMDRALEAAEQTHDAAGLLQGVKMVAQQFQDVLAKYDCVKMAALNAPFDPHVHEAVMQQPNDEHPAGTVLQVTQAGFQLHDRVVRPSQVIVSTENPSEKEE